MTNENDQRSLKNIKGAIASYSIGVGCKIAGLVGGLAGVIKHIYNPSTSKFDLAYGVLIYAVGESFGEFLKSIAYSKKMNEIRNIQEQLKSIENKVK